MAEEIKCPDCGAGIEIHSIINGQILECVRCGSTKLAGTEISDEQYAEIIKGEYDPTRSGQI
jgi:uncharacterized Zn finger protein